MNAGIFCERTSKIIFKTGIILSFILLFFCNGFCVENGEEGSTETKEYDNYPKNTVIINKVEELLEMEDLNDSMRRFAVMPSLENSELFMKKFSADKFLSMIFWENCKKCEYDQNTGNCVFLEDSDALKKRDEFVKLALKKGANPNKIEHFCKLPSIEISKLLFEKIQPHRFLDLVYYSTDDRKENQKERQILYTLVSENYKLEEFSCLSYMISKLMLARIKDLSPEDLKKMKEGIVNDEIWNKMLSDQLATDILNLASAYRPLDANEIKEQNEIIELAIKKGANTEKLKYPDLIEVINKKKHFLNWNQTFLRNKIAQILETKINLNSSEKKLRDKQIYSFKYGIGHCLGLTAVWFLSHLFDDSKEGSKKLSLEWFAKNLNTISTFDSKTNFTITEDLDGFINLIDIFQCPENYEEGASQTDHKSLISNLLGEKTKIFQKKYSITSTFLSSQELESLMGKIVYENEYVFLSYNEHVFGLLKKGNEYMFYDSNDNRGMAKFQSLEEVSEFIFKIVKYHGDEYGISFTIFGDPNNSNEYPKQSEILKKFVDPNLTLDDSFKRSIMSTIRLAFANSSIESLKYLLEKFGKFIDHEQIGYYIRSAKLSDPKCVNEMLKLGFDFSKQNFDIIHKLASEGYIDTLSFLLESDQSEKLQDNINKKSLKTEMTPLMIATEKSHLKTVKLLLKKGADKTIKNIEGKTAFDLIDKESKFSDELKKLLKL